MSIEIAPSITGVSFDGVHFGYGSSGQAVLRNIDWQIDEGEFVVVAGESGSGKSTLLRCLNGLVPHFSGGRFGGSVVVNGFDTKQHGPRALSTSVGFVFQDPDSQRVAAIVEDELAFGMEQLGIARMTMRKRVEETLDLLGIADLRDREMETLSGGERQRVAVAAALTLQPRILVLDEPTSQLDPWGAEDVVAALERLNHDLGLTVIMSEHRLERVIGTADRLHVLIVGGTSIDGSPRGVLMQLDENLLPPVARIGRALEWSPLPLTIKEGRAAIRGMTSLPVSPSTRVDHSGGKPVVELRGLRASYGKRTVLKEIDLQIRPGEVIALMGRNGSGKTTLLRSIMGFQRPVRGTVLVKGVDVTSDDPADIGRSVGYLAQRPGAMLFNETVSAELAFSARHHPGHARDLDEILEALELEELRNRNPRDLSAGEQERTALAAVLIANPSLLLLDEPTRGMDSRRKRALARFIMDRKREGVAVIIATHDVELVAETATRVVIIGAGEVVADGPPRDVLSGSLTYTTQMNKLFGLDFLTVDDVLLGFGLHS